uniref:Uncharacterized protein n=1 Tax=Lepeophtheirus salmonis TaxID=72036 RepID=A0A0K2V8J0_LEPSM
MPRIRDRRISICVFVDAGKIPTEVSNLSAVFSTAVYAVSKYETLEKRKGFVKKDQTGPAEVKEYSPANTLKSMRPMQKISGFHTRLSKKLPVEGIEATFECSNDYIHSGCSSFLLEAIIAAKGIYIND